MRKLIAAIDQGTTGTTVLVLDQSLNILGRANQEFTQHFPQPGWVEHNPKEILSSVQRAMATALKNANAQPEELSCIGITNQRETVLIWDKSTGEPVANAIVWQDRRTTEACEALKATGVEDIVKDRTGLLLDPYFSGSKIAWLLDTHQLHQRARRGELMCGTIDTFLVWHLTGRSAFVTDVSNASRTLLLNLKSQAWDEEQLNLFGVPPEILPTVKSCSEVYGYTQSFDGLPNGVPVSGMAGDQQAALFGQACFQPGEAKCTYGTGAFVLMNTGQEPVYSKHGLLTSVGWSVNGEVTYVLEGSAFVAGAAVQWLRDGLGLIKSAPEIEQLAASCEDTDGVYFVPALTGLGAPHWQPAARGEITGLTRGTTASHLARATLEGIAYQNYDILDAMTKDSGISLAKLKVDGGAAANELLMQFQADLLNVDVVRPKFLDTTAFGAAFLAGLGIGLWTSQEMILQTWQEDRTFKRTMDNASVRTKIEGWHRAVHKAHPA